MSLDIWVVFPHRSNPSMTISLPTIAEGEWRGRGRERGEMRWEKQVRNCKRGRTEMKANKKLKK